MKNRIVIVVAIVFFVLLVGILQYIIVLKNQNDSLSRNMESLRTQITSLENKNILDQWNAKVNALLAENTVLKQKIEQLTGQIQSAQSSKGAKPAKQANKNKNSSSNTGNKGIVVKNR